MAERRHHIDLINSTDDLSQLRKIRNNLMSHASRELTNHPELGVSTYQAALDLVRLKIDILKGTRSTRKIPSPVSPVPPKPKDWEAEAMEWKRIADEWKKESKDSQKREAEWKSKAEELEKKLLGEENMDKMWNGKFEKLESEVIAKLQQLEVDCAADIKIKDGMIESLQKQLEETREAYFHDIEIMENEIEDIKREYDGILEERDLEAKEKEDALHQEIEALQKKGKGRREKVETQKNSRVSSGNGSVSTTGDKLKGYKDEKMGTLIKGLGLEKYFVAYANRDEEKTADEEETADEEKTADIVKKFRIMYREGITNAEIGHLGKYGGKYVRSRYYWDTDEDRIRIVNLIKESMEEMKKKKKKKK